MVPFQFFFSFCIVTKYRLWEKIFQGLLILCAHRKQFNFSSDINSATYFVSDYYSFLGKVQK